MSFMYIAVSNTRGLQASSLLANGTRSTFNSIHSIQMHIYMLIPTMTFYDAKPQSVMSSMYQLSITKSIVD